MRKIVLALLIAISFTNLYAQKEIREAYLEYTIIRTNDEAKLSAINIATNLLKRTPELTNNQVANLNFHLGRLYEETMQEDKAIPHYEASLVLVPDYYVTHRALANIYLRKSEPIIQKMNDAGKLQQRDIYAKLLKEYKQMMNKMLPHLEKAQACDPDEQNLQQITKLYKNIKDINALTTLDARLKKLGASCIDLLED